jgi:hypothetical protein
MRWLALIVLFVLAVAGCGSQVDLGDEQPGPATPKSPSVSQAPVVPLSAAQSLAAALTLKDRPAGWDGGAAADPYLGTEVNGPPGVFEPAKCSVVLHAQDELGKPLIAMRGSYFLRAESQSILQNVGSWPERQPSLVQKVTDALAGCTSFKATAALVHDESSFTTRRLLVPGLADAVAVRLDGTGDFRGFWMYLMYAVRGGTVLHLRATGGKGFGDADFVRTASKAVARLDAVVG